MIRDVMINQVLPAIQAKWPRKDVGKPIFIQHAPSHLKLDDPLFCEAAKQEGFNIRLICQPPNSPDFNILDLGFLNYSSNSIQEECKNNRSSSSSSARGNLIKLFTHVSMFSSIPNLLIHFLHNCFVGILGVLGTQSKLNVSNTTKCFDGSYEGERMQQVQDSSHEKNIRKRRSAAIFYPL
jgi:hypothetical protein